MGKNLLKLFVMLLLYLNLSFLLSQDCKGDEKKWDFVPKELYRGRLQNFGRYGNPYTMFAKEDNFNLGEGSFLTI